MLRVLCTLVFTLAATGCATLSQIAALRQVEFSIDGVTGVRLAGADLSGVRTLSDLGIVNGARIASAMLDGELPLQMEVQVLARNPADNAVDARLVEMDWTLLLEDRETVSGRFSGDVVLPRGVDTMVPVTVELNLVEFFEGSARDLVELAAALAGAGGAPKNVTLTALPTIQTALGPIRYDRPIRIVSADLGG